MQQKVTSVLYVCTTYIHVMNANPSYNNSRTKTQWGRTVQALGTSSVVQYCVTRRDHCLQKWLSHAVTLQLLSTRPGWLLLVLGKKCSKLCITVGPTTRTADRPRHWLLTEGQRGACTL